MIKTENAGILEAIKEIKVMSLSKRVRMHYEARLKSIRDRRAREEYVWQEGRRELLENLVMKKIEKGKSIEAIAEELEEDIETILVIIEKKQS